MRENTMLDLPATDYRKEREQGLFDYLDKCRQEITESKCSAILIPVAKYYWDYFKKKVWNNSKQILEVPDCCPNSDGSRIMFTWDRDEHYLECEIDIEGEADFFYSNRLTKETWGDTYNTTSSKLLDSEWLLDKLSLFTE